MFRAFFKAVSEDNMSIKEKSIFSQNTDIDKTAYLNWRMDSYDDEENMSAMAEAYFQAANILVESVLRNKRMHQADALIFPIIHTVNQMIEIYVKSVIKLISRLNKDKTGRSKSHDIDKLVIEMRGKIIKQEGKTKEFDAYIDPLLSYIDELKQLENINDTHVGMDFSRYPLDTNEQAQFYVRQSKNIVVDMEVFSQQIRQIRNILVGLHTMYEERVMWMIQSRS